MSELHPITMLIAALGGEGGGVLSDWIVAAADAQGFPVQSTSIPGVAQRTGATTYYIEILPVSSRELNGRRPVLALTPGVGDVDVIVASELLEAGRAVAGGFAAPGRTTLIASTHRAYAIAEKTAVGDGRYDAGRLAQAIAATSRDRLTFDMAAVARQNGAMINAVMLGAIAASARLPIPAAAFEAAIRADGRAVEANLRGFRAGLAAARGGSSPLRASSPSPRPNSGQPEFGSEMRKSGRPDLRRREGRGEGPFHSESEPAESTAHPDADGVPAAARDIVREGARRLAGYQSAAYARLYLDRLVPLCAADVRLNAGGRLAAVVARHLALRMSYEDVIRVAEAKIAPERFARIAGEVGAGEHDPVRVFDYLKPGIDEICQLLPPALARRVLEFTARRGWRGRLHWGMEVETTSVLGYLRFWLLARLKVWRPRSHRYAAEQQAIEAWLELVRDAARISGEFAIEVAECARIVKGYGDTWQRGMTNYLAIEARVIRPVLAGRIAARSAADAVASARAAALIDPDGESLGRCLADIESRIALPLAAE